MGLVVADAVGRPAQRQLAQVARAQYQAIAQIGQPEQMRGALARPHNLEGDIIDRLAADKRNGMSTTARMNPWE
jgi:hypothetical protein